MKLITQTPKKSLNKAFLKQPVNRDEIDSFKANLQTLLSKINENESEEHHKNFVRDFLKDTFYKTDYEINTKGRQDLVIHIGKDASDHVSVIIEAKKPTNKADMISSDNPNRKALHELILYFLRERIDENNIDVKYLIVTNINEWFIFDAGVFNQLFFENKSFVKEYKEWRDKQKTTAKTDLFYNEIAKPYIESIEKEISCTYFDIRDYQTALNNDDDRDDESLIELFKILSPNHLLKIPFADDSNKLDKNFYTELLHIIGLEEIKDKSKLKIQRRDEARRDAGSLIENTITIIKTEDLLPNVEKIEIYGETREERVFNIALDLCLTWINRVLFLKLLEAQLVDYHNGNRDYRFLDAETIKDFDGLYRLFHQVLAINFDERISQVKENFRRVPYLNSSLFEFTDLERQTLKINSLNDTETLNLINTTVLKEIRNQRGELPTLEYLFKFLDAYDFASEGREGITEKNRSLINASVLGKVFEKINGYKDGSIYTPGFITMYMCRQAIRLAVVQKFKDAYGWNISEFTDIKNYLADYRSADKIKEFNALVNSLHLCDPAVGSGHFLVSSLNEIIAIKGELGILADENGERFRDVEITVENDELTVFDTDRNEFFKYRITDGKPANKEAQRLQKTLFHEKQTLIENCLFGVDINPNSVKICRLRLWIELLKNAYYKENDNFAELETLPNIDINIKEGNSLLSRFALDADLKEVLKNKKNIIAEYRNAVSKYKNEKNRDQKRELLGIIEEIKGEFTTEIYKHDPKMVDLAKKERRLFEINSPSLFEKYSDGEREVLSRNLEKQIAALNKEIADIKSNAIYKNAFEWRFEFPEVLDNDGNFTGFDIVIGNPPYGVDFTSSEKKFFKNFYENVHIRTPESFNYFVRRFKDISKSNGFCHLIIPSSFLNQIEFEKTRKLLLEECSLFEVLNLGDEVFVGVTAPACIIGFEKIEEETEDKKVSFNYADLSSVDRSLLSESLNQKNIRIDADTFQNNPSYNFINRKHKNLFEKCYQDKATLKDIAEDVATGISPGLADAFILNESQSRESNLEKEIVKKLIIGGEVNRFILNPKSGKEIIYFSNKLDVKDFPNSLSHLQLYKEKLEERVETKSGAIKWFVMLRPRRQKLFDNPKILIRQTANRIIAAYDDEKWYGLKSCIIVQVPDDSDIHYYYLLSLLNSSLMNFLYQDLVNEKSRVFPEVKPIQLFKLPIKKIEEKDQQPFVALVDQILELKRQDEDTQALENEIDALVYRLYDLTADEIKIVEGKEK